MKKFIIFTYTILFYSLTPFYELCAEALKSPCSKFFSQTERRPSSEQSANEMIQALIDYSGATRETPWIQKIIQLMEKQIRVKYPDSTEIQALLKFLEEKIGDKNQLLKVLKLSPSLLIKLRKNSLNTHLQPLFKTLEDIFGQDIVLNKLKHSLQMIQLKIEKTKQIIDILKGQIPIPIFENQRVFEIKLALNDKEIKNLFIQNVNIYKTSLKNLTGSTSLKTGKYEKGTIQVLWPFIKSLIKATLTTKEKNFLHLESDINTKTTEAIEELLLQSPQLFTLRSKTIAELFNFLTGKEKLLVIPNNKTTPLDLGFKEYEIGQLILEHQMKFLRNNKTKLKSNIEILWPFIEALKRRDLESSQKDRDLNQDNTINKTLAIKNFFTQTPQGFTKESTSLNNLIEILTGKKSISFQSDEQTITLELNFKDHEIGYLFSKDPQGFSQMSQQKLEFTIKTLWPFIKALSEKNLKPQQRNSEISQENIHNETIKTIKKTILQSLKGLSITEGSLKNLIDMLKGKKSISFRSDEKTITFELNFEDHEIGYLFSKDPRGFSQMSQQKLEFTIKTLWPFIEALSERNLKSQQRNSEISQESIRNETVKLIKKAILQSLQGFSPNIKPFKNLIEILKGKEAISFQSNGKIIKLTPTLADHEIAELFLGNPQGFTKKGIKNLEKVFQNLWSRLKGNSTTIKEMNSNQIPNLKLIIRRAFSNKNLNSKREIL